MKLRQIHLAQRMSAAVLFLGACLPAANATAVPLQKATATHAQTSGGQFPPSAAIDGNLTTGGWAIGAQNPIDSETIVFETVTDIVDGIGSTLVFTLTQNFDQHNLGRFRLSVTTDDRSLFADEAGFGNGDVTANWTVLDSTTFVSTNGATLTELGDLSILASGTLPNMDVYTISALTPLTGITGFRLEAMEHPSLAIGSGPGRNHTENFVLTEFQVEITPAPEPGSLALLGSIAIGWGFGRRRRR